MNAWTFIFGMVTGGLVVFVIGSAFVQASWLGDDDIPPPESDDHLFL